MLTCGRLCIALVGLWAVGSEDEGVERGGNGSLLAQVEQLLTLVEVVVVHHQQVQQVHPEEAARQLLVAVQLHFVIV